MPRPTARATPYVLRTLDIIEWLGLALIVVATVVAVWQEGMQMLECGKVLLEDILLLFIYLEVLTMVGLYFRSGKLPLRYPIYIAIVAIARYIIIGVKEMSGWTMVALAFTVVAIRYGHLKLAYPEDQGT